MEEETITIIVYVDENGIIENPEEDIVNENVVIKIDIKPEVKQKIKDKKIAFCNRFLATNKKINKLGFIDNVGVQIIKNDFLEICSNLTDINLSGLSSVTQIGTSFLYNCTKLRNIDFSQLSNVTQIDFGFLMWCVSLKNIDLSGLSNIKEIDERFLHNCRSLRQIKILNHQKSIILKYNEDLELILEINGEWYNTFEGKTWIKNSIQQCNNIQDSDILFDIGAVAKL
jgi:hypothetical protein